MPRRATTPSFITELPLKTAPRQEEVLLKRLNAGRQLYNAVLGEAMRRVQLVRQSKIYRGAKKLRRDDPSRKKLFKESRDAYQYSEYALHSYATQVSHSWVGDHLDANTVQKLATRAYQASEKVMFGRAKKVRFKGKNQLDSLEGKTNKSGIRWKDGKVVWLGLELEPIIEGYDPVIQHGLATQVKYVRLVRRKRNGKNLFCVQLINEGTPFQKPAHKIGSGIIGIDIGPSTIAIVGDSSASLQQFANELKFSEKKIPRLQRKMDRSRRANNPDNYNLNGTIKKGKITWNNSKKYLTTAASKANLDRKLAGHRKALHGRLVHEILRLGDVVKLEKLSYKAFQKLFGKSVGKRAPGMFVSRLKCMAESAGAQIVEFPTYTTKLSQTCLCGQIKKKRLSERVHQCECGVLAQRDLFSAFLALYVDPETNLPQADLAQLAWSGAEQILSAAWQQATTNQPASGGHPPSSFGKPPESERVAGEVRITSAKSLDVVAIGESQEKAEVFPIEPPGFSRGEVQPAVASSKQENYANCSFCGGDEC